MPTHDRPPRVVLVTGASSGIGEAAALAVARRGDHLVLLARGRDALERVARDCDGLGAASTTVVTADISADDEVGAAVATVMERHGSDRHGRRQRRRGRLRAGRGRAGRGVRPGRGHQPARLGQPRAPRAPRHAHAGGRQHRGRRLGDRARRGPRHGGVRHQQVGRPRAGAAAAGRQPRLPRHPDRVRRSRRRRHAHLPAGSDVRRRGRASTVSRSPVPSGSPTASSRWPTGGAAAGRSASPTR